MTLGLSVNSRIVGLAVIKDGSLHDYRIRLFKERWTKEKLERILTCIWSYRDEYGATCISLIQPHKQYTNPETRMLLSRLKARAKKDNLILTHYQARELHRLHDKTQAKKKALMQALSLHYPELSLARKKELANKKRYYAKLFEAVGAAMLCERDHY